MLHNKRQEFATDSIIEMSLPLSLPESAKPLTRNHHKTSNMMFDNELALPKRQRQTLRTENMILRNNRQTLQMQMSMMPQNKLQKATIYLREKSDTVF